MLIKGKITGIIYMFGVFLFSSSSTSKFLTLASKTLASSRDKFL